MNSHESKTTILVTLMTVMGALLGAIITSLYQSETSNRVINKEIIELLADKILNEKHLMLKAGIKDDRLNQIFQHKENAFLVRQLTKHIKDNFENIDLNALASALASLERRYSYAQIYKYKGLAEIVCENLNLTEIENSFTINEISKCPDEKINGVSITLKKLDINNHRARLKFENDNNNLICKGGNCEFWVDVGDRLESTPYKTLVLIEYIGMNDAYHNLEPIVSFSIIRRTN